MDELSAPLRERGLRVETIGDAFAARSLQHAILEGHQFARELAAGASTLRKEAPIDDASAVAPDRRESANPVP